MILNDAEQTYGADSMDPIPMLRMCANLAHLSYIGNSWVGISTILGAVPTKLLSFTTSYDKLRIVLDTPERRLFPMFLAKVLLPNAQLFVTPSNVAANQKCKVLVKKLLHEYSAMELNWKEVPVLTGSSRFIDYCNEA